MSQVGMSNVLVIQTGGTIDKAYPKRYRGYAFEIDDPAARRILERVLCGQTDIKCRYETACQKDSQDILDSDRDVIIELCNTATERHILVTHGTDTLIETASYISRKKARNEQVMVFTGAFKPETMKESDADFNMGVAFGALQCLPEPGVYVAMSGRVIPASSATRHLTTHAFMEALDL